MKKLLLILMLLIVAGCAATPPVDTYNKQRAAFEITYQELLLTALSLRQDGLIDASAMSVISETIDKIEIARSAADAAEKVGDLTQATDRLRLAQTLLYTLSDFLKKQAVSNVKFNTSDRSFDLFA